ncbi:uncharacterized protein LOC131013311 [Salvia miltiorrhiza]|uniref:uncharacterized protein LOC131013311 n=1 Tax=Salvia miltiorrhiza TaxID=226208 RepID=UPI0025AC85AC|nr:uncharacterized protein LOC131013311 [Salvia miltiorrhiza]
MQSWRFCISLCLFLFASICKNHAFSKSETDDDSYSKYCSAIIPRYNITARSSDDSLPSLSTTYFIGGGSLLRIDPHHNSYYADKNLRLRLQPDFYRTTSAGVYKVQGFLYIQSPYNYDDVTTNYSDGRYSRRRNRASGSIKFPMNGFWSEKSRKLCMIGSTWWRGIDRDAVLKLKFADDENPTIYTSVVSGSLESRASANDPSYFDPILIFDFLEVSNYKYSLVTEEVGRVFPSRKDESLSLDDTEFCSVVMRRLKCLELEYAKDCAGPQPHHCSPLGDGDGFLPRALFLTSIQCLEGSKKARFMATFLNRLGGFYDNFVLGLTVIGEASWDDESNRLIGVACGILNPSYELGNVVGNCTTRLILRFPSFLTMRNDAKIAGQIWSSKGYFKQINLTTSHQNHVEALPEQRYEYTELDKARKSCTKKAAKKGDLFPDGQSPDMRFDMIIKNGKGQELAWASATPLWVGNDSYQGGEGGDVLIAAQPVETVPYTVAQSAAVLEPVQKLVSTTSSTTKISYKIRINRNYKAELQSSSNNIISPILNWPVSLDDGVEITAEGVYDAANGHLCMMGCRRLVQNSTYSFKDCDIVVEFNLPPLNRERGSLTKGVIRSTRLKEDPLHFDDLILHSYAYYRGEAERSIWRMDLEIAMVLISNTLTCIFVALQIFHVKRNPEVPSSVSLGMLVVLSIGHMIPLVLNFEAVFLGDRNKRTLEFGSGGRLEANEVAVRVITMVALLLQLRLFQLIWTAKQSKEIPWSEEKKAGFVSLMLYVIGALLTLLLNRMRQTYAVWGVLWSYAGLILDGFLVPQILLNVLRGSAEKALSHPFYVGTSAVRLVPHAYNQYRAHNYPKYDLNATYYYANPAADMYSTAWDIIIPCGVILLAVIVFVQQRHGGRCILPRRLRALEMHENVPITDNHYRVLC